MTPDAKPVSVELFEAWAETRRIVLSIAMVASPVGEPTDLPPPERPHNHAADQAERPRCDRSPRSQHALAMRSLVNQLDGRRARLTGPA